jgi:ABC-2 type transport system permease protein
MIILLGMMRNGLPQQIPIAVVDYDNSSTSRTLIRQLDAFPKTNVKFKSLSFREARIKMEKMEIFAILTIPKDFAREAVSGDRPKLVYYTNNSFLISGSLLFQDLKIISTLAAASVGLQTGVAKGYTEGQLMPIVRPISVEAHPLGNPWLNYSVYLNNMFLPGILQLIVMIFTISGFGAEVKSGNGRKLLRMSGSSIFRTIAGKLLPYTILYTIIALLMTSVLYHYNGFPLNSGFLPMFFGYFLLIIASQGFGLILLAAFKNYRFSVSIACLVCMIAFSLSGFSFPGQAMHPSLYALSFILPLKHFFLIYVDQALNGISIGYSMYHYAALLGFLFLSVFFFGRIRKFLERNVYES